MTIFEYLSIAASIVLALALGKLASAIPYVVSKRRFDGVYALLFFALFVSALLQWWLIWQISDYSAWSFSAFIMLMASPIVLFVLAHILVSESPAEIDSWKSYLSENHRLYFSVLLIGLVLAIARGYFFLGLLPTWSAVLLLLAILSGAIWNNRLVLFAVGVVLLMVSIYTGLRVEIGT